MTYDSDKMIKEQV